MGQIKNIKLHIVTDIKSTMSASQTADHKEGNSETFNMFDFDFGPSAQNNEFLANLMKNIQMQEKFAHEEDNLDDDDSDIEEESEEESDEEEEDAEQGECSGSSVEKLTTVLGTSCTSGTSVKEESKDVNLSKSDVEAVPVKNGEST